MGSYAVMVLGIDTHLDDDVLAKLAGAERPEEMCAWSSGLDHLREGHRWR